MTPKWRERKETWPKHYEEHVARMAGLTLRVRGPRGGSVYKWTIERVTEIGDHPVIAHGSCVIRDGAQRAAVIEGHRIAQEAA